MLRHEVSTRLGWEWAEPRNNLAELKQWPTSMLRAFSRRREQIEAFLAGGETTWARTQAAAIQTRQAKGAARNEAADRAAARARLGEHLDAHQLGALLARGRYAPAPHDAHRLGSVFQQLLGEHGLTERDSSFARGDVMRELAFALGSVPDGDALLTTADSFLALEQVTPLDRGRCTTRSLLAAEQRITQLAQPSAPRELVLSRAQAEAGIERTQGERGFTLSDEQRALVHGVTADPGSPSLVRAVAGSVRPHDARHCFGTYMGFAGVPSHTLRLVIGHSSIKATERYLHRLEEAALEAGSALSRYAAKQLDQAQPESSQDDLADLSRAELIRLIGELRRQLGVTSASSRSA